MGIKRKDRITVIMMALILFGFLTGNIVKSDEKISISERRKLAQFPKISVENIKDGIFMSGFESYAKDQFLLREQFRALKTAFSLYVLGQRDQHGLYIKDGNMHSILTYLGILSFRTITAQMHTGGRNRSRMWHGTSLGQWG